MSFGQEMKDFLAALDTTYDFKGSENRKLAAARRKALEAETMPESYVDNYIAGAKGREGAPVDDEPSDSSTSAIPIPRPKPSQTVAYRTGGPVRTQADEFDEEEERRHQFMIAVDGGNDSPENLPGKNDRAREVEQETYRTFPDFRRVTRYEDGGIAHADYQQQLQGERGFRPPAVSFDELAEAVKVGMDGIEEASRAAGPRAPLMLLRGTGAATPQEVAAIDRRLDPRREMSADDRAEYRLAAMVKWKLERGDAAGAKRVAAALLMHSQLFARQNATKAMVALQNGDAKTAVRYANEAASAIPDGKRHKVEMGRRGFVYTETNRDTGKTVQRRVISPKNFGQLAEATAGGLPVRTLMQVAGQAPSRRGGGGGSGGGGRGGGGRNASREAAAVRGETARANTDARSAAFAARAALEKAKESGDPKAVEKAQADYDAARERFLSAPGGSRNVDWTRATRMRELEGGGGPATPTGNPRAPGGRPGAGSAAERREASATGALDMLGGRRDELDAMTGAGNRMSNVTGRPVAIEPTSTGMRPEGALVEGARRANEPRRQALDFEMAGQAFKNAKDVDKFGGVSDETRGAAFDTAIDDRQREGPIGKSGKVDTTQLPEINRADRTQLIDIARRTAEKNKADVKVIADMLYSIGQDPNAFNDVRIGRDGRVHYRGATAVIDRDDLLALTAMRGRLARQERQRNNVDDLASIKRKGTFTDDAGNTVSAREDPAQFDPSRRRSFQSDVPPDLPPAEAVRAYENQDRRQALEMRDDAAAEEERVRERDDALANGEDPTPRSPGGRGYRPPEWAAEDERARRAEEFERELRDGETRFPL
jgi:hypothetical protein